MSVCAWCVEDFRYIYVNFTGESVCEGHHVWSIVKIRHLMPYTYNHVYVIGAHSIFMTLNSSAQKNLTKMAQTGYIARPLKSWVLNYGHITLICNNLQSALQPHMPTYMYIFHLFHCLFSYFFFTYYIHDIIQHLFW